MTVASYHLTTGLPGLDRALRGLMPGDNVVWQMTGGEEYREVCEPLCRCPRNRSKVIYFRFSSHAPVVPDDCGVETVELHPERGFEQFLNAIHRKIQAQKEPVWFIFDCLSDLAEAWHSDQMLGNFFQLLCSYVFEHRDLAYFMLYRGQHSLHATSPVLDTCQIMIDYYRYGGKTYIHPLKVQHRYSPSMHALHVREGDDFLPVTDSMTVSQILSSTPWSGLESTRYRLGVWRGTFIKAEEIQKAVQRGEAPSAAERDIFERLLKMAISRDEQVLDLARKHLTLDDVLDVRNRMIGSGLIGGKATGVLLARAILRQADPKWNDILEVHDSFFIGSDVFHSYLVRNGTWWVRQNQQNPQTFLEGADAARQAIMRGSFPDYIVTQFADMLNNFGQSPIVVRSSSLLEDNFGNAFAGKYESMFCPNQGPRATRLEHFIAAMRIIYASTMSEKALLYRARRDILDRDEQMSVLVQRVSGMAQGGLFFPHAAGVGFSFNPYVWNKTIDPEAGVLRIVFGLGTRAVDRADDDYTRVVALNAPRLSPDSNFSEARHYAQRRMDVLDLEANNLRTLDVNEVARRCPDIPFELFASRDEEAERMARDRGIRDAFPWILDFKKLLSETSFVDDMREMLDILATAYAYPVDVEFTVNFFEPGRYRINLVQCRPLQITQEGRARKLPRNIEREDLVVEARGGVIGHSRQETIDRLIYVSPSAYSLLSQSERYAVARAIGQVVHHKDGGPPPNLALVGPGRWGTTTPTLGVPVSFSEISAATVICEIVAMRQDLIPDVSLGTHFFSDLVETNILYVALFPEHADNFLNADFFERAPNRIERILPGAGELGEVIKVIDARDLPGSPRLILNANTQNQRAVCYFERDSN